MLGVLQVFVSNGWLCDTVIVVAVTNRRLTLLPMALAFLVENGMKGFIKGRKLDKIGIKAQVSHNTNLFHNISHL